MRERWARRLAVITCSLVLLISVAFAATRNASPPEATPVAAPVSATDDAALVARGRDLYASLDCASCHSIAGQGSPRSPLDGVGSQLDRDALREWIIAGDSVSEDLSPRAIRAKQGYRELGDEAIESLVAYMASLTE